MKTIGLKLTVEVVYSPNGTPRSELIRLLENVANHAANNGLFTGETRAVVEEYCCDVTVNDDRKPVSMQ